MIVELGHFALILALFVALAQTLAPLHAARTGDERVARVVDASAVCLAGLVAFSFGALTYAYVVSDFSVANVYQNSHSAKPLLYKVSGVWGNHEGSMLLWILMLALFGAAVPMLGTNLPSGLKTGVLGVQGGIIFAFCLFIVFTSNPFARLDPAPVEGLGLNPILQDPALAIHPPLLYAGYVGFSVTFSFAVAALIEGRIGAAWARWVRPWTLAAWMFLTVGIALGSWWAYYELGWGGWWFWDPVENASFMPWLAGTALLHSALVVEKRESLKVWTILLAIVTFSLSLLGTFLVRSGVLSSVHAFAVDPARGVFILALLVIFIGGALTLFAARVGAFQQTGIFAPVSREGALVVNNVLLAIACATVLVGTLYPLALEAVTGDKISVGPPYFNLTFGALMAPLLLVLPLGPCLAWKRADLLASAQRLWLAAALALVATAAVSAMFHRGPWLAPFGLGLGLWIILGTVSDLASRAKFGTVELATAWRRLAGLPRSTFAAALAHSGVGVMLIGIVASTAYGTERILVMKPGDSTEIAGYELTFRGVGPRRGANYRDEVGILEVTSRGAPVTRLEPAKRTFDAPRQVTTEAGIHASWAGDLYAVLGDAQPDSGHTVRLHFHPFVRLIWSGALIMFLAGAVSLSDRRLRVGVRPRRRAMPAPAGVR